MLGLMLLYFRRRRENSAVVFSIANVPKQFKSISNGVIIGYHTLTLFNLNNTTRLMENHLHKN